MLRTITSFFVKVAERWMPDPLVIAIVLTLLCYFAALAFTDFTVGQTIDAWGNGYWSLLQFTCQMILILALGHVVAHTRPVNKLLTSFALKIHSPRMAYVGITLLAGFFALFSWGIGLIVPAVVARIIGKNFRERGIKVDYPLLVACGYSGTAVGMQGLSASIQLILNTPDHFLIEKIGLIPLDQTIFSTWSMSIVAANMILLPIAYALAAPDRDSVREMALPETNNKQESIKIEEKFATPSQKLENSRWVTFALGVFAGFYIVRHFLLGGSLNLNSLNMIFVVLGLLFCDSSKHYVELLSNAAKVAGPFLIQYPLYAGLMGIMASSGLGELFVEGFVHISTVETLPLLTFASAAILNIFIPSAGGQWAVQGPIMIDAALQMGADIPRIAMSVAIGESWTNAIQPLYAVPVLAIAGLHIRDIMGYCVIALLVQGTVYLTALTFF